MEVRDIQRCWLRSGGRDVELVRNSMKCVPGWEDRTVEVHGKRRKCWEVKSAREAARSSEK